MRLLTDMREAREIPFGWVADNTRWMRKPISYASLSDMLERQKEFYRRDLWDHQNVYTETCLEKDASAGVIYNVTKEFDVALEAGVREFAPEADIHFKRVAVTPDSD